MTQAQQIYIAKLPTFEGNSPWMYQDARKINRVPAPLVTVGKGCAIDKEEAMTLPFVIDASCPALKASSGIIGMHYDKVSAMPGGRLAPWYHYSGCMILLPYDVDALVGKRLATFTTALIGIFPDYLTWPVGPQIGALDLAYGVGAAGFHDYTHFIAACKAHDWKTASTQCAENVNDPHHVYEVRNGWRKQMMLTS